MAESREPFLRVTFGGGRFAAHVMPVDALAELVTLQQVVLELARAEFKRRNPDRVRVPRGFAQAARLDLSATEANCFTATLRREAPTLLPGIDPAIVDVVIASRDAIVAVLDGAAQGREPGELPAKSRRLLARMGDRLGPGEWIEIRTRRDATGARVDDETRARLSALLHAPLEQVTDLDGEVEEIDDRRGTFLLRLRDRRAVSVDFDRAQRGEVIDALDRRPAVRVQVRARVQWSAAPRAQDVESFEVVDHERWPEVERVWQRIDQLAQVPEGWMNGAGEAPGDAVRARAREVLARLLVDHPEVPRPKVFPTPDGGLQAEWVFDRIAADARFSPRDGAIEADAVDADRATTWDRTFTAEEVRRDDASALAAWLNEVRGLRGNGDVHEVRA